MEVSWRQIECYFACNVEATDAIKWGESAMRIAPVCVSVSIMMMTLSGGPVFAAMGACEGAYVKSDPEDQIRLYSICLDGLDQESLAGTYHNRGVAYLQTGELERAMSDFDSSILWDSDYGLAYFNRATIYALQSNPERAIADLTTTLDLRPSRVHRAAYLRRGALREIRGDYAEAMADYEAVAQASIPWFGGERTYKLRQRAQALIAQARLLATAPDDAIRDGQRAVALAEQALAIEESAAGRAALAAAYAETGQIDRAIQEQTLASQAGAEDGSIHALFAAQMAAFQAGQPYRDEASACVTTDEDGCLEIAWTTERMHLYRTKISTSNGFAYGDPDSIE